MNLFKVFAFLVFFVFLNIFKSSEVILKTIFLTQPINLIFEEKKICRICQVHKNKNQTFFKLNKELDKQRMNGNIMKLEIISSFYNFKKLNLMAKSPNSMTIFFVKKVYAKDIGKKKFKIKLKIFIKEFSPQN